MIIFSIHHLFIAALHENPEAFDVIVVGAGAAGIGIGVVLKDLGLENFAILERHQISESFRCWLQEMHFITPSFSSHGFGHLDLNAIAHKTSPAISFRREHLNGKQYTLYLEAVADYFKLTVYIGVEVQKVCYSTGRLELIANVAIEEVKVVPDGYAVYNEYKKWVTPTKPILGTGFEGSLKKIAPLFNWADGHVRLTDEDESTLTPGLFVVGLSVRHSNVIFCFIYKFRQRFAVVVNAIAHRLGIDPTPLEIYRQEGLFLEDLSCFDDDCVC